MRTLMHSMHYDYLKSFFKMNLQKLSDLLEIVDSMLSC